jgi:predicted RNase H-like nuclease
MTIVLGVDACRSGWVGVEVHDGRFAAAHVGSGLAGLLQAVPGAAAIGVDMPLGLVHSGWRQADVEARKFLGPRRSSLFLTPPRAAFAEETHAAASGRCRQLCGHGMSIQAWGLKAKVQEANTLREAGSCRLWEVHPETSFTAMGLGPGDGSKKSWRGQRARLRLLLDNGIDLPDEPGPAGDVPTDDLLDAAAAAWTASRIATGAAKSLPDPPQIDERGQDIAIWY